MTVSIEHMLRNICWERAKGELRALQQSYSLKTENENYTYLKEKIDSFIRDIEDPEIGWEE